jgi:hypothetical protein
MFSLYIRLESMPRLIELRTTGRIGAGDATALRQAPGLAARIEVLEVGMYDPDAHVTEYYRDFKHFLEAAPRLRELYMGVRGSQDLSFLATAELPSLEILELCDIHGAVSIASIISMPRRCLHSLLLATPSDRARLEDLPMLTGSSTALPVLHELVLTCFYTIDWTFMPEIALSSLKHLLLFECRMTAGDVILLGEGLRRLPQLEVLEFKPSFGLQNFQQMDVEANMNALVAGGPLPSLRRLMIGGGWRDTNGSINALMQHGDNTPLLEEITLERGRVDSTFFLHLSRSQVWPHLTQIQIEGVVGPNGAPVQLPVEQLRGMLHHGRPNVALEFVQYPHDFF